jgi:transposase
MTSWTCRRSTGFVTGLVSRRTAVINQIRAFLLERGMVFAQKPAKLKAAMADVLENAETR